MSFTVDLGKGGFLGVDRGDSGLLENTKVTDPEPSQPLVSLC